MTSHPAILVVDDDEASRYVKARVLESQGFSVGQAGTGEGAIDLGKERQLRIHDRLELHRELIDLGVGRRHEAPVVAPRGAVDLLQVVEVGLGAARFRVRLGIGGDGQLEVGDLAQARDEVSGEPGQAAAA